MGKLISQFAKSEFRKLAIPRSIVLMILFISPLIFSNQLYYGYQVPKEVIFKLLCIGSVLLVLISVKDLKISFNYLDCFVLLRVLWILPLIFLTERYSQSIDNIPLSLYLLVYFLLIKVIYINQDQSVESIFKAISIAAVIEAVFGIIQQFNPYFLGASVNLGYETQVIASFGGANSLGCFLALSVPCILYLIKRTSVRYQKGLWLFGLVIICTALILTLSRGAWIALFIGLSFYFSPYLIQLWKLLKTNNKKWQWVIYCIGILIIGFGFFIIYHQNLESSIGRIFLWKVSLLMFLDKPVLGIGYGNYSYLFPDYQAKFFDNPDNVTYIDKACNIKMAHSEFFHILAETGIIGILLFIILIVSIGIVLFRLLRTVKNEKQNTTIRLMGAILIIILTHSIVDTVLHVLPISLVFYTCIAFLSNYYNHQKYSLITIRLRPKLVFIFLFLILLGITGYSGYRKINGYYYWRQGLKLVSQHKWQAGIDYYQKALKYLPDNGELKFHLGSAYSYTGELEKAYDYLDQSIPLFKDKNQYMVMGVTCMNLGKYELAEHYLRETTYMFPQMLYPHFLLAQLYDRTGYVIRAISELQYIIEAEPRIMSEQVKTIKQDAARIIKILEGKMKQ